MKAIVITRNRRSVQFHIYNRYLFIIKNFNAENASPKMLHSEFFQMFTGGKKPLIYIHKVSKTEKGNTSQFTI